MAGIVTSRDLRCWEAEVDIESMDSAQKKLIEDKTFVKNIMTPHGKLVHVKEGTSVAEAVKIMTKHRIEKLPYLDDAGRVKSVLTLRDVR